MFLAIEPNVLYAPSIKGLTPSSFLEISSSIFIFDYDVSHQMSYGHIPIVSLNIASFMSVLTANGTHIPLPNIGYVSTTNLFLYDVYYFHNITLCLAFVSQLCDSGYPLVFSSTSYHVHDP